MSRKSVIAIISVILISFAVVYLLQTLKRRSAGYQNPLDAVPLDAIAVLKSTSLQNLIEPFLEDNQVYNQLQKLPQLHQFNNIIHTIDSLSQSQKQLKSIYANSLITLSAHKLGKDKINLIYFIGLDENLSRSDVISMLNNILKDKVTIKERNYEGFTISDVRIKNNKSTMAWTYSLLKDLIVFSPSSILLENALRQIKQEEKIYNSNDFKEVQETIGKNVHGNVFINYKLLPEALGIYFRRKNNPVTSVLKDFATWGGMDLHIKPEALMLSGFTHLQDSLNTYINLFSKQEPQKLELYNILPSNSNTFFVAGVDNFPEFNLKYNDHLNFLGKYPTRRAYMEKIQKEYNFSFYDDYVKFVDNEFGFAFSEISSVENSTDFPFVVIKTKSGERIKQSLEKLINAASSANSRTKNSYKETIRLDEKTRITIYEIPLENFSNLLLGHFFDFPENRYATVIDNYIVLGVSPQILAKFSHLKILGKTMNSNPVFTNFSALMSDLTNVFFYTNIPKSINIYNSLLKDDIISGIKSNNEVFQKLQALGIQFNVANKRMFTNAFLQYNKQFNQAAHTVWETLLDTAINFKPVFVKNHYTHDNEIFVQDLHHNIYLINKVGRVLWKLSIEEQINSEIYQVDYYRNGKLQYLFSTSSDIHLIDREGNYVERYPVSLRAKASAGMSLFDYDNNHDYRIFIPTQNKKVYLYDLKGNLIQGWEFDVAEHVVKKPVKHFRIGSKDYIVFSDGLRLYILNRRGQVRVPVNELISKSENNEIYLDEQDTNPKMVTTNSQGEIVKIQFNGSVERHKITDLSSSHYFNFEDVNADGKKDYIFLDNKELVIYTQNGEKLFSREFSSSVSHPPVYYHFSFSDRKIGITSADENKIYLINSDGSLYNGFPLTGNTPFSIGRLSRISRFNLIVGNSDNFLLNYSVQ